MSSKLSRSASRYLDVTRGGAALLVVAGHARFYTGVYTGTNPNGSSPAELTALVPTTFAREAVAVFFVLSGFLVGGQVVRQNKQGRFSWPLFAIKRLSRLWTVLLPGLLFTYLLWCATSAMPPMQQTEEVAARSTLVVALGNAAFLNVAWVPSYSVNHSLWSLSYEFWFYFLFAGGATALFAAARKQFAPAVLASAIAVAAVAIFGPRLLMFFPAWLIGVVVERVRSSDNVLRHAIARHSHVALAVSAMLLVAAFLTSNLLHLEHLPLTLFVAVPAALLVLAISLLEDEPARLEPVVNVGVWFGLRSFSIYVFHLPIVVLLIAWLHWQGLIESLGLVSVTYGISLVTLPLTWVMWWLTERHTDAVRTWMLSWANIGPHPTHHAPHVAMEEA